MYLIRLLIIGDTSVGKTSLILRFHNDNFLTDQKTTIGVDYKAKEVTIGDDQVKLQIWDTAGQERFRSMTAAFFGRAQGIAITFDVSQRNSFENLPTWIQDIKTLAPPNCAIVLIANKVDYPPEMWKVRREEYIAYSKELGVPVYECSASNGQNVQNVFNELGKIVLETQKGTLTIVEEDKDIDGKSLILSDFAGREKKKSKQSCCTLS